MCLAAETKPPPKFDFEVRENKKKRRIVIRAIQGLEDRPALSITDDGPGVIFRLTSKKARLFAKWLLMYAEWAETIPSPGGR